MRVKARTAFVTRLEGEAVSVARGGEVDLPDGLAQRLADGDIVEIVDVAELEQAEAERLAAEQAEAEAEQAAAEQAEAEREAAEKAAAEKAEQEKSAADHVTVPKKRAPANKRAPGAPQNK